MREDQFFMVLPSNSSMRHFPENVTLSFTTELPQTVHLHGGWEVTLSEIQFPKTLLHIKHGENVLRFVDVAENQINAQTPPAAKDGVIPNGIYKNIEELISVINSASRSAGSHLYLELQNETGGKIFVSLH
ncbi:hypothetical protein DMN91_006117 [Ooceraea biroi]|uniref:Uncharacterized protein n=1 Tax=Ooceraea biroi TaxID=2015173 RepID=A0A3L8DMZ1_OOCBI|nr:hypothetical protein DMN91_006117 [Ooceraea biroi]